MGLFTLQASNIKGKTFQFAPASRVLCELGLTPLQFETDYIKCICKRQEEQSGIENPFLLSAVSSCGNSGGFSCCLVTLPDWVNSALPVQTMTNRAWTMALESLSRGGVRGGQLVRWAGVYDFFFSKTTSWRICCLPCTKSLPGMWGDTT